MTIEKRYAEAFLEYAKETIGFEKGLKELNDVKDILRDNPDFKDFLENPAINYTERSDSLSRVLAAGFSEEMRQFLTLLLKKDRMNIFHDIASYARMKYAHGDEIEALLNTTYPLDTELVRLIKERLENKFRKKVHLYVDLDPDLLGGVRVTVGNTVIDGSVKKRLDELKDKLTAARVN